MNRLRHNSFKETLIQRQLTMEDWIQIFNETNDIIPQFSQSANSTTEFPQLESAWLHTGDIRSSSEIKESEIK